MNVINVAVSATIILWHICQAKENFKLQEKLQSLDVPHLPANGLLLGSQFMNSAPVCAKCVCCTDGHCMQPACSGPPYVYRLWEFPYVYMLWTVGSDRVLCVPSAVLPGIPIHTLAHPAVAAKNMAQQALVALQHIPRIHSTLLMHCALSRKPTAREYTAQVDF